MFPAVTIGIVCGIGETRSFTIVGSLRLPSYGVLEVTVELLVLPPDVHPALQRLAVTLPLPSRGLLDRGALTRLEHRDRENTSVSDFSFLHGSFSLAR
jgi:hypothetical protein